MARRARRTQAAQQASEEARQADYQCFLQQDEHMVWRQWVAELEELNGQAEKRRHLRKKCRLAQQLLMVDPDFTVLCSGRKVCCMH
ncbi:hypothetical protein PHLCEN_2v1766 [Hermanssonia centrifuga]|uniref:Uncharacterized protein n=1 Tax=Hermanssonia centrifuga TaxID=98765 RepID=A0A2R6RW08_9APHY|nr:hypothetical protein PHLCEN_2v1766 [Hermanssonia centrifuga]